MAGLNKALLIGHLGRDPELRYTAGGQAVCNFSLATSEKWTDKNTGETNESTEWHKVVVWGKSAEACAQYLAKGSQAYVEGKLQTRDWENREGEKKQTTEIRALTVQFLGGKSAGSGGSGGSGGQEEHDRDQSSGYEEHDQNQSQGHDRHAPKTDDIPF